MTKENHRDFLSDEELVKVYRSTRDKEIVGILFKRYTRFVFLVCMKYLKNEEQAKDMTMQTFETLFHKLKRHEIRDFKPWLHTVTKNHCLIQLRKRKEIFLLKENRIHEIPDTVESEHILHLSDEKEKRLSNLEDAILLLSKEQRLCIELFYLKKMRYQEVSQETGFTYKQVKSHIQNGKRNLRIILEQKDE
ncbi:MAG: sigma-70 family RNA polymerase sigma factor [Bacteroidales bacterium]|nr:sigma-70 family RNA polymerase sigma factor [Bacteroidales bacterium]